MMKKNVTTVVAAVVVHILIQIEEQEGKTSIGNFFSYCS